MADRIGLRVSVTGNGLKDLREIMGYVKDIDGRKIALRFDVPMEVIRSLRTIESLMTKLDREHNLAIGVRHLDQISQQVSEVFDKLDKLERPHEARVSVNTEDAKGKS